MLTWLHARGRPIAADLVEPGAVRRPTVAPSPDGAVVAAVSALQAQAGNRATAGLLGGTRSRRPTLQRDALAATTDAARPGVDPSTMQVDPAQLTGDGESGPRPSDWAQTGAGGDGPAPPIPAVDDGVTSVGDTIAAAGGATATGERAGNLLADAGGGSGIVLTGGNGQPGAGQGAGQVPGQAGTGDSTASGAAGQTSGGGQPTGGGQTAGGAAWTQRPEGSAIVRVLSASAIGQEAIATASRYAVVVVFQGKGRPAAYDAGDNHCYLDPATATNELATYFVHEMHHARQTQLGLSPLPDKAPDREVWVDAMVQEEVKATWLSFEARVEAGISTPLASGPLADAWNYYLRIRREWREKHLASHPNDTAGADALATAKGRALVRYLIVGVPDTTTLPGLGPDRFSSYAMFYRRQWNIAHGAAP